MCWADTCRRTELNGIKFFRQSVVQESRLTVIVSFYAPYSKRKNVARNIFLRLIKSRCLFARQIYALIEQADSCKHGNEPSGSINCGELF